MLKIFKDLKILYYLTSILGGVTIIFYIISNDYNSFLMIYSFIWIFACAILINRVALKRNQKMNQLYYDCKEEEFIDVNQKYTIKKGNSFARNFLNLNLSAGYIAYGEVEKAYELLSKMNLEFSKKPKKLQNYMAYCNNLATCCICKGELEQAEQLIQSLNSLVEKENIRDTVRLQLQMVIEALKFAVELKRGNAKEVQKYYEMKFETAKWKLEKIVAGYNLATIYKNLQEVEKQQEYLHYVADNGGDTGYAKKAKAELEAAKNN